MKQLITIGCSFGSGGKTIGQKLADRVGLKCYDKELLTQASIDSGLSPELFEEHDEKPIKSFFYSLVATESGNMGGGFQSYVDVPMNQKIFLAQFETIQRIAREEGGGVFVGRCADYALEEFPNVLNVFIYADLEDRIHRICERFSLSKDKAVELITKTDKKRASYYNYYSTKKWGVASTYDLCLNSSRTGEDGAVDTILYFLETWQKNQ